MADQQKQHIQSSPWDIFKVKSEEDKIRESPELREMFEKRVVESNKLAFDLFKHLTTLSTGSILLLVTFIKDILKEPNWQFLINFIFGGFIVSIVSSVVVMWFFSIRLTLLKKRRENISVIGGFALLLCVMSFLTGIISLIIFVLKNLNT